MTNKSESRISRSVNSELQLSQDLSSRRDFLIRASSLGLSAVAAGALWNRAAAAATPQAGGRLRIGASNASISQTLDPAGTANDLWAFLVNFGQLRNCLVEIDHHGKAIPELAEHWEASADATVWRFNIRRGVEFHNGKTLDAEDVVWSLNHHRGTESKSAGFPFLKPIQTLKTDGKYTVEFTLKAGNADFPHALALLYFVIVPKGTEGAEWDEGVGTGGYTLQEFEPGVRALTKRNLNYWKAGRAHFDEVETLGINDVTARTNALQTGTVDVINRIDLRTIDYLEKKPGINIVSVTGTRHFAMPMLTDKPPFDDNNVRLALKYGVNRKALLATILRGHGTVGNDHPIAPIMRYYAANLPQRKYDPDKARFYLQKAGLKSLTVTLATSEGLYPGAVGTAELYKEEARPAGIDITINRTPDDGYWSDIWMKQPFCMSYWSGRPTEDAMFTEAYSESAPWNESHWRNRRFNELLAAARIEFNDVKRREMYVEMQSLVRNEGGTVIPVFADNVDAANDRLQHGPLSWNRELDGDRIAERWWFA